MADEFFKDEPDVDRLEVPGSAGYIPIEDLEDQFEQIEKVKDRAENIPPYQKGSAYQAPPPPPVMNMEMFSGAVFGLVHTFGAIATARTKTDPLSPEETKTLVDAVVNVVDQYPDIGGVLSPKVAAWLGLGMATLAVVQPRVIQSKAMGARDVTQPPHPRDY